MGMYGHVISVSSVPGYLYAKKIMGTYGLKSENIDPLVLEEWKEYGNVWACDRVFVGFVECNGTDECLVPASARSRPVRRPGIAAGRRI